MARGRFSPCDMDTKAMHVTSLADCSRRYGANKKTRILVGTVLEVEIGPKATALGRCRIFLSPDSTLVEDP